MLDDDPTDYAWSAAAFRACHSYDAGWIFNISLRFPVLH